jgi:hypothetical protein
MTKMFSRNAPRRRLVRRMGNGDHVDLVIYRETFARHCAARRAAGGDVYVDGQLAAAVMWL